MPTTVDLPPAVHYRMRQVAAARGICLPTLISELATSAFNKEYPQAETGTSTVTGLPQLPLGHPVSSQDVAAFLTEEDQTSHSRV
ncbi:toxin-antitoxin system, antitoxin component [Actinomyces sp. HMT897]|uniref:toxin-antitoxin system, antitoxin component n=1 Tax=Actinomyces sp. HMT897 TaxID=2789424 RepID=UPI00190A7E26|nr:toxin-antitoxin system, antitoxin component [Actinomyces sp. HMT897]QQO77664.1 toxin-antitoxin system, antitoxin component [Actinomyces sp. HMT897]